MLKSKFQISIISLIKDDNLKFLRTLRSIKKQEKTFNLEWVIIDGANKKKYVKNKNDIKKNLNMEDKIYIKHINTKELNINGIYPCMNYGKKVSEGNVPSTAVLILPTAGTLPTPHISVSPPLESVKATAEVDK